MGSVESGQCQVKSSRLTQLTKWFQARFEVSALKCQDCLQPTVASLSEERADLCGWTEPHRLADIGCLCQDSECIDSDSSGPMHVRYRSAPVTVCLKIGPSNVAGAPCTDTVYRRLGSCFHQNSDAAFPTGPWSSGSYQTPKSTHTHTQEVFGRLHRGAPSMLAPWAWRCYQRLLLGLSDPWRC